MTGSTPGGNTATLDSPSSPGPRTNGSSLKCDLKDNSMVTLHMSFDLHTDLESSPQARCGLTVRGHVTHFLAFRQNISEAALDS